MWKRHMIIVCYIETLYIYFILTVLQIPYILCSSKAFKKDFEIFCSIFSLVCYDSLWHWLQTVVVILQTEGDLQNILYSFGSLQASKGQQCPMITHIYLNNNNVLRILPVITHLINEIRLLHRDYYFLCLHIRKLEHRK